MRYIFTCILMIVLCRLGMAQINRAEYFIDSDPGFGNGTPVNFSPSSAIDPTFNVPLTSVSNGFHILYMRVRDVLGRWSITHEHVFFNTKLSSANQTLKTAEYFIDTDPGFGKGTSVSIPVNQNDATVPFNVNLSDVSIGAHTLYVRVLDKGNIWSQVIQHAFFVKPGGDLSNIVAFKYNFERTGFTSDTLMYQDFEPAPSISLNFNADLSGLSSDAEYTMNIWAISSDGLQSLITTKKIKACSTLPAKAKFDFIISGKQASFIDSSLNVTSYYWDFGDGQVDSVSNPIHVYQNLGEYKVQLITQNICNSDTLIRTIVIKGIQTIQPTVGGNSGSVSMLFYGVGFDSNTFINMQAGSSKIIPDTIIQIDEGTLQVNFNFKNELPGQYDIEAVLGNSTIIIPKGFNLVADSDGSKTFIDIIGRDAIRIGVPQTYEIRIGNSGLIDALGVPVFIIIEGDSSAIVDFDLQFVAPDENLDYSSIDLFAKPDSLYGKPFEGIICPLLVSRVPANGSETFNMSITTSKSIKVSYWTGDEFTDKLYPSQEDQVVSCVKAIADVAIELLFGKECIQSAIFSVGDMSKEYFDSKKGKLIKIRNISWILAKNLASCAPNLIPAAALTRTTGRILKLLLDVAKGGNALDKYEGLGNCIAYFSSDSKKQKDIRAVTSFDPNEKVGPEGSTSENFVQGHNPSNYKIYFENLKTATAPAPQVIIVDSLDKQVYDITTFQLNTIGFGSEISINIPVGLLAYSTNVDLRPRKNMIVRVDAKLDTSSGVLTWRFISLDPKTMELTDDPLEGFLPPNVTSPQGEGFVSFSVQPRQGLASGTQIKNKATIYFDANPPIATNTYLNTIDKIIPTSSVNPLTATVQDTVFTVKWAGEDQGSGVRSYDVYYSENNGPFKLWQYDVTATEARFIGQKDSTYGFYSISKDFAGNIESEKTQAETTTQIVTAISSIKDQGWLFKSYPNPFDSETIIEFELPSPQSITLIVRDIHGKKIVTLVDNKLYGKGNQKALFNNAHLPAGIYFCELKSDKYFQTIKLLKF